jgi:hypothetical protein
MNIEEGKSYYFYDNRANDDVCKAHVLSVLPHPEREDDRLIVYLWYGKHRQRWWYGVTTISQQELWAEYCQKVVKYNKDQRKECKKCGQCGYFMRYVRHDGTPDHDGDCGSIEMNKECNEGVNPFNDDEAYLLQVDETENACGLFKKNRTRRIKDYIKKHPQFYVQSSGFMPKPVR